jgi:DNA-directed RNA polymerase specialized sigma24 family protein
MERPDDEEVCAAVAGDGKALTALLRDCGPLVRQRLSISPVWQATLDLEDVMQVTYLEAFRSPWPRHDHVAGNVGRDR